MAMHQEMCAQFRSDDVGIRGGVHMSHQNRCECEVLSFELRVSDVGRLVMMSSRVRMFTCMRAELLKERERGVLILMAPIPCVGAF